ncbi:MAG: GGDEF domain-containing protein, partial [Clostridia bacterium]|nr:GGDEF domain-containing protein [Clostridia bacterium]
NDKKIISFKRNLIFVFLVTLLISIGTMGDIAPANQTNPHRQANENLASYIAGNSAKSTSLSFKDLLTPEEKDYISKASVIRAATVDGAAPLCFSDENGEIQGIFQRVLDRVSAITGLTFECTIYPSVHEALNSNSAIIYGISSNYAPDDMVLSQPFLETETILYMNSLVKPDQLEDKLYAAVKGSALLEGIKEENTLYFDTREDSLNAVENGMADYGYGNAYSVAYYALRNGYQNIVTVPIGKEAREYCIGLLRDDDLLLSIINKSLNLIDAKQMQTLILNAATHIDRKITFAMVLETYGLEITVTVVTVLGILVFSLLSYIRVSNKLREQNRKYEILSQISNEYLYEYFPKEKRLRLSDKFNELFDTFESTNEIASLLEDALSEHNIDWPNDIIRLPLPGGRTGAFKAINSYIYDPQGRTECIIGKLIDVSEEIAEKEALLIKSQIDEMTGLYNAATTRNLITARLQQKENHITDAFILMDCDNFKNINDTQGHLAGNQALKHIAAVMKQTYRNTDILGRLGGDEFCVYMKDVPSVTFVQEKCRKLCALIQNTAKETDLSVSIGIAMVDDKEPYDAIFKKADTALYQAKGRGKARTIIYNDPA